MSLAQARAEVNRIQARIARDHSAERVGVDISERKRSEKIQQATSQISEAAHAVEDLGSLYPRVHQIINYEHASPKIRR